MDVSMKDIKALRDLTNAGLADIKKALQEAEGDHDKAVEILRKRGQAIAAKRSERTAEQGCVLAKYEDGFAAIVALKCETDFVSATDGFRAVTEGILDVAMKHKPKSLEELLALTMDNGHTVEAEVTQQSGVTGEKVELGHYEYIEAPHTYGYIHAGNMLAAIAGFNVEPSEKMANEICMQIASMNPVAIMPEGVTEEIKERELEIARDKAREQGKPENLLDRIAEGSLNKYYKENCLLMQESILDSKKTVEQILKSENKELTVVDFKRVNLNKD